MTDIVSIKADGKVIRAGRGRSLLSVLLEEGFDIPHLCHHEKLTPYGACRLCLVEIERRGRARIATSCNYPVMPGIEVRTDTERVMSERRTVFELLLAQAPESEKLKHYAAKYGVCETTFRPQEGKCILCGLCERVCTEIVGANAIDFADRGGSKQVTAPYSEGSPNCIGCAACAFVCPTGAIEVEDVGDKRIIRIWHAELQMRRCRICGSRFAPEAQIRYFARKLNMSEKDFELCPSCRVIHGDSSQADARALNPL